MPVIDISREYVGDETFAVQTIERDLQSEDTRYTGVVYQYTTGSMMGTYIDFPGHIKETDDGMTAANFPIERLYRIPAAVIHLDRADGSGGVSGEELERSWGGRPDTPAIIINALGRKNPHDIRLRSVFLDHSALDWIIGCGCKFLVSDIFESVALHGVFLKLFQHGVSTLCEPVNLAALTAPEVKLTVLFPPVPGLTQIPCRAIAEF